MTRLARAFGRWPHEVEALGAYELGMAQLCLADVDEEAGRMLQAAKGHIQPVLIVGGPR